MATNPGSVPVPVADRRLSDQERRILNAALECASRWGVAKTSLDDVARQAKTSRATIYRLFPGGKVSLMQAVLHVERERLLDGVVSAVSGAACLEDALVAGMTQAGRCLVGSPALTYLLAHEPELILPYLAFGRMDELLVAARSHLMVHFAPWLEPRESGRVTEWLCRIVLSYLTCPSDYLDLADPASVRRLVRRFILPGLNFNLAITDADLAGPDQSTMSRSANS